MLCAFVLENVKILTHDLIIIIDTIHGTGLETAHALPLTQYKNLRATRVSRETSVAIEGEQETFA